MKNNLPFSFNTVTFEPLQIDSNQHTVTNLFPKYYSARIVLFINTAKRSNCSGKSDYLSQVNQKKISNQLACDRWMKKTRFFRCDHMFKHWNFLVEILENKLSLQNLSNYFYAFSKWWEWINNDYLDKIRLFHKNVVEKLLMSRKK